MRIFLSQIFGEKRAGEKKWRYLSGKNIMSDILGMLQEVDLLTDGVNLSSLNRAAALNVHTPLPPTQMWIPLWLKTQAEFFVFRKF